MAENMMKTSDALRTVAEDLRQGERERAICLDGAKGMERMEKEIYEYQNLGTPEELSELVKAKQDGRLAVLPIPFGEGKEVYGIAEKDYDDEVPKRIVTIDCEELERVEIWPSGELVVTVDGWEIGQSDIGKTVFLTREEAEAAKEENDERD